MKLDPYLIPYAKINSKWVKDLNIRAKAIKLLEIIEKRLHDVGFGNDFLDMTPKTQSTNIKIDKLCYVKIKNSYATKSMGSQRVRHNWGTNTHT